MKPIGFVKRADGELAAVLAEGGAVYVVKAGDHFARRYRALRVSPESVEVVEDWKDSVPLSHGRPKLELTANNQSRSLPGTSSAAANLSYPATYVFQTLGYVEALTGELEAVVADGEKVYLIKQGERFGDDYRAISVDPSLVLAVRASPGWDVEKLLARQSDFRQEPASKLSYGTLHSSTSAKVELCASREAVAHVAPHLEDLGVDLINIPGLAGLDSQ